jgi:hypothetical protein
MDWSKVADKRLGVKHGADFLAVFIGDDITAEFEGHRELVPEIQ